MEHPQKREPETLSPPSDVDASNQIKVANVLLPGQNSLIRLWRGANLGLVSQKCTQGIHPKTVLIRLYPGANPGLVSQKIHPKNIFGNSSQNQLIKASTNYWPNDLLGTIYLILNVQCPWPSKPEFQFQLNKESAAKNFCVWINIIKTSEKQ